MKQLRCGDLIPGCVTVLHGDSDNEILEKAAVHAREEHGVDEVPPEIAEDIRAAITELRA